MKNKLLFLNILSYIILYHIVYELVYFYIEKGNTGVTPLGFIIFKFNRLKYDYDSSFLLAIISFIINMTISGILLNYIYKWKDKMSTERLFWKIFFVFIIVSILSLILLLLLAGYIFFIFMYLYLPMPIMVILMIPLFKFNQWITEQLSK